MKGFDLFIENIYAIIKKNQICTYFQLNLISVSMNQNSLDFLDAYSLDKKCYIVKISSISPCVSSNLQMNLAWMLFINSWLSWTHFSLKPYYTFKGRNRANLLKQSTESYEKYCSIKLNKQR